MSHKECDGTSEICRDIPNYDQRRRFEEIENNRKIIELNGGKYEIKTAEEEKSQDKETRFKEIQKKWRKQKEFLE